MNSGGGETAGEGKITKEGGGKIKIKLTI